MKSIAEKPAQKLSLEALKEKIKSLISISALSKIEIGELLIEYTQEIEHGGKKAFYKQIGMSPRTAQYYMKIASNPKIQKLKKEGKLDGLNMSRILELVGMRVNIRGINSEDAPKKQYIPLGPGSFDYEKCRSTAIFKLEYKMLTEKLLELEETLQKLYSQTA